MRPLFLLTGFFCSVEIPLYGPPSLSRHVGIEFLNVGGWLTHSDLALEVGVDFLAVAEHRLIPARVRSEWSRLRVVSMRGAPLALPTFATAQFKRFFDYGRAVRCMLPLGLGGSCIWLFCMVIRVLMLMLSSLL